MSVGGLSGTRNQGGGKSILTAGMLPWLPFYVISVRICVIESRGSDFLVGRKLLGRNVKMGRSIAVGSQYTELQPPTLGSGWWPRRPRTFPTARTR
ncbi:hypothetical protein RSSM_05686 [Rhodopirellula sallentina SM41]|uniref:Uncharacterized protein n=1 Tax=Rhodopirellula sallentina SM41 TaxID=1263870 RepID=M5TUK1_9BACT|nr:hypothetical protein RSSM_05686 [Rhodopirellula sallentina SM41]